jgi:hypothetical protein
VFNCSTCRFAARPDEIVRMLPALRNANLFLQNEREINGRVRVRAAVVERFYALYREQFNPRFSRYPKRWSKN